MSLTQSPSSEGRVGNETGNSLAALTLRLPGSDGAVAWPWSSHLTSLGLSFLVAKGV